MKALRVDPERLQEFAVAYVPAVKAAAIEIRAWLGHQTLDAYAVDVALLMHNAIQQGGIRSIAHYDLNTRGGAFRLTCQTLQIEDSVDALEDFIGGR